MPARLHRPFAVILVAFAAAASAKAFSADASAERPPNFIIIFCDDLGYGDLGCFGSENIRTPNVDRMAKEGMRLTSFYSTSGVCSPSRSSLMTGCYPRRVNLHCNDSKLCVLFPADRKGLHPDEVTIADALKPAGYATMCVGKWHLGDQPQFLPTQQGFDSYFGIPYSNDMGRKNIPLPLLRDEKVIVAPVAQETLTGRYTEEVVRFIEANKDRPFFLYLPHTFPHVPLFAAEPFRGKSPGGKYGDAVEEIDWSTGKILAALKRLGLDRQTLVVFTSDNGAAGGSNAPLQGRKGSTDEGGMRVPCIVRWPGRVAAGTECDALTVTFDLLPTLAKLAGVELSADRTIDGRDIAPLLLGHEDAKSPHEAFYYYQVDQLQAVRSGRWKLHLPLENKRRNWGKPLGKTPLKLFDLQADIHENDDVSAEHPEVVKRLTELAEQARLDLGDEAVKGAGQRKAGWVDQAVPQLLTETPGR
ncbi:MAG: sulfatase [Candidatus Nealsonbacteria bacterium]|nr:sulfatase [Candidatus Nealsonbacteria bacterium]